MVLVVVVEGAVDLVATHWHLPREVHERNFHISKSGLSFGLSDVVSFDLSYSVGREAPTFKFTRTGSAGFGLKF